MAKRIVNRMDVDGIIREYEEEYDPEREKEEQEWHAHHQAVTSKPAAEAVLNDPNLMRLWCDLDYRWTNVEHGLYFAFDAMLSEKWWVTRPIYYKPTSNSVRREMVEEVAKAHFWGNDKELKKWKSIFSDCAASANVRNKLFHGFWGWSSDGGKRKISIVRMLEEYLHSDFNKRKFFTLNEIALERDKMITLAERLNAAVEPIQRQKREQRIRDHEAMLRAASS